VDLKLKLAIFYLNGSITYMHIKDELWKYTS
jgi:hypothetical protein